MNLKAFARIAAVTACLFALAPSAFAAHQVCHREYHHHHPVRVCHWVH
ncbi:hypothetical protein [Paraburkholderia phosphatilytica]|jgi:hypothetical protein|nr:hypothetical protein [Paraburkholderia phosphatilytica]